MKIKNILLGTVVGSLSLCGLVSCDNDFLEEKSYEYTSSTSYNTPEELDMAIGFLHGRIQYLFFGVWGNHNYFMTGMGLDTFAATDQNYITSNWKTFTPDEPGYSRHWYDNLCQIIQQSNIIIDAIDTRDIKWDSETQRNEIRAEAIFFRAWAHRCLAGMYGDTPIILEPARSAKVDYERSPRMDVWKQCAADFEWAAQNLPLTTTKNGRIVKAAADHMLAEMSICIGDVSGKGVAAAMFMAFAKTLIHEKMTENAEPDRAFEEINRELCSSNPEGMFVTAFAVIFDKNSDSFLYINAGHNKPVAVSNGKAEFLECKPCIMLGVFDDARYVVNSAEFGNGDIICLYTDGVNEATNADNEFFGNDRLVSACQNAEQTAKGVCDGVYDALTDFTENAEQFDDITIVAIKNSKNRD